MFKLTTYTFRYFLSLFIFFIGSLYSFSQNSQTFTSSGTYTVPACATSIVVQCWGGGGGGGGGNETGGGSCASGGGGGGFAQATINNPSGSYTVTVGIGGQGGQATVTLGPNGNPGGNSVFTNGTITITATGGGGGYGSTGSTATSVGTGGTGTFVGVTGTTYTGGNGGQGNNANHNIGGSGGGGAGSTANGGNAGNASRNTLGAAGAGGATGGGAGGVGVNNWAGNGGNGSNYGGGGAGGGGASNSHGSTQPGVGGNGAQGQVIVTYYTAAPTITSVTGSGCPGSTITINGTNLSGATSVMIGSTSITNLNITSTVITGTLPAGSSSGIITVTNGGCGSATSSSPFVVYAASAPVNLGTQSICPSSSYSFGGRSLTTAGTYSDTTASVISGCDSITTVTIAIATAISVPISQSICIGDSFLFGGHYYSTPGSYIDTTTSAHTSCDSITTLTLTVNPIIYKAISQTICANGSYSFGGHVYTTANTYIDSTASVVTGCDSITVLTLTVVPLIYNTIYDTICANSSYSFGGHVYAATGIYMDTATSVVTGCDSITTLNLLVNPLIYDTITTGICTNGSYTFGGHVYTTAGNYKDTAISVLTGCDSITVLNLSVNSVIYDTLIQSICSNSSYSFGGNNYTAAGIYRDTAASVVGGCDSITTLILTVNPVINKAISGTICATGSYSFGRNIYSTSGTYMDTTASSVTGCDSITTLTLTVIPLIYKNIQSTICANSTYSFGGQNYSSSGTYSDTAISALTNCDSVTTLVLVVDTVPAPVAVVSSPFLCTGDSTQICATPSGLVSYVWGSGITGSCFYDKTIGSNSYTVTVTDVNGCSAVGTSVISLSTDTIILDTVSAPAFCSLPNGSISVSPSGGSGPYQYSWSIGKRSAVIDSLVPGIYQVTVSDNAGCSTTGSFSVGNDSSNCEGSVVLFPTAFTPNDDGKNDLFNVIYSPTIDHFQIRIYDRWGQVVFESGDVNQGWDGTYKGTPQPIGVYIWFAQYDFTDKPGTQSQTGNITLIR